ncbi:MAG TPA: histidine kinase dimerization/phospho-acceptor domain-containing protein [Candidatus Saccharimonadales bacterium]|nr:histidine kinase dimerization/phospho-acceptor domain-containing protein [Candidatus Saccharimonadales bacterium]
MNMLPRQRLYLAVATAVFAIHLVVAGVAQPSFDLTLFGDTIPIVLLILAILAARENFRQSEGVLAVFWRVFAAGLACLMLSQFYWYYYDWRRLTSAPTPIPGDSLFILANVFFLSALALRPHSSTAGRDLRTRSLDFVLLSCWWLFLYGYFSLPWQVVLKDFSHYNPSYYLLALIQHSVIFVALIILAFRKTAVWRRFYLLLAASFALIAAGNLLLSVAIDRGWYYAGSLYDTPFFLAVYMFTYVAGIGSSLRPSEDVTPNRELIQSVWTARLAMLGVLSLPLLALLGLYEKQVPTVVASFRLKFIFEATFLFGILVYLKLGLLASELVRLLRLTRDSISNLNAVQQKVVHTEKLIALGRLASGAAHEISNPLTAILGYSELLTDVPSLSDGDRSHASSIRQQAHRAQAAVTSLRTVLRQTSAPASFTPSPSSVDKSSAS